MQAVDQGMTIWGIDPGLKGALSVIHFDPSGVIDSAVIHPIRSADHRVIPSDFRGHLAIHGPPNLVVVERVSGAGANHWGSGASFSFGKIVGSTLTMLHCLDLPILEVHPRSWKAHMIIGKDKGKKMSITACQALVPSVSLIPVGKRTPSHDYAESVLIAVYGYYTIEGLIK